jgi:oxygen-dependent protoporphyrinogen oxidase
MKHVTVIGGGFSGLTTAYYLANAGLSVRLLEKQNRVGGLIGTLQTPQGPVELAASGIRSSARLEQLCAELDLPMLEARKESRARYLYRNGPKRWPLGPVESMGLGGRLLSSSLAGGMRPRPEESIDRWAHRVLGPAASHYIVGAALQGIYAGDPERLSASLIFGRRKKPEKGRAKGLTAPEVGMSQLIDALERRLIALGVSIETGVAAGPDVDGTVVICTSAHDARELIRERAPQTAAALDRIEMLPLIRVTAFYPADENRIGGLGVLFPRGQGIRALGVLFNTNIFANRGAGHSESWIYGGSADRDVMHLDDDALFDRVHRDRAQLYDREARPIGIYAHRWQRALPHYDIGLERLLREGVETPSDTFLTGNYLNGIGLPLLLERSWEIAQRIQRQPSDPARNLARASRP